MEHPVDGDTVLLAAGERADVLVAPRGKPGSRRTAPPGSSSI